MASTTALSVELTAPNGRTWTQPTGLFIDNEFVASTGGTIDSIDPATEEKIATVAAASAEDVDRAVRAAHKALRSPAWKNLPPTDRGALMWELANLMEANKELLATIDAWDNGKTYTEALETDLVEAVATIRYYAGWADKTFGQTISTTSQKFAYTVRQPVGVVAQIIPWNYPLSMATWKLGPALACGCAVVLKAAEQTPLSALVLGGLVRRAGFPPGVVNLLNGRGGEAGAALAAHPLVDKVAFTGSTATAAAVMALAARTLKPVSIESGGKSPLLVFGDADMEQAVNWAHLGIMSNQGQICTATSRVLVHEAAHDEFLARFLARTAATSVLGSQWDAATYQGPLVSRAQLDRVLELVGAGVAEGATLAVGGKRWHGSGSEGGQQPAKGYFVEPTVFTGVTPGMRVWREEIFGPVVVIARFRDEAEAVALANDSAYGLGSAVFTRDLERAHRVAAELESGMVWVNSSQDCDPRVPFGGVKQSGIGRELGEAGLQAYSQLKAVHVNMGNRLS